MDLPNRENTMKRNYGEDEHGKYEEGILVWRGPQIGYEEIDMDSPEAKEILKKQLMINISRKRRRES